MTRTHTVSHPYYMQDTRASDVIEPDGDVYTAMLVVEARTEQERSLFMDDWSTYGGRDNAIQP